MKDQPRRYQQSEWTGTNEPTPRTRRRVWKENERMKKKIIKERYVTTDRSFRFTRKEIGRLLRNVYDAMGGGRKSEFMVFAFGVLRYHGQARELKELAPEYFDAVGFALMEKLIELRRAHA